MTAPIVYLSARGQDAALVAAVVKARLESQGCLVRQGGAEVRSRSQCARHYGPLLQDCDVFIQLIGVDPGPLLSSEEDDDFWSLQVWESREAAKRKKPMRHYLLDEDFCRAILSDPERPAHLLKKQARHRRKLASSPAKVRKVRDTDELLRVLPIIRLADESLEKSFAPTVFRPEAGTVQETNLTNLSPSFPPVPGPADHAGMAPCVEGVSSDDDKPELPLQKEPAAPTPSSNVASTGLPSAEPVRADLSAEPTNREGDLEGLPSALASISCAVPQALPNDGRAELTDGAAKGALEVVLSPAPANESKAESADVEKVVDKAPLPGSKPTFITSLKEKVSAQETGEISSEKTTPEEVSAPHGQSIVIAKELAAYDVDEEEEEEEDPLPGSKPSFITTSEAVSASDGLSLTTAVELAAYGPEEEEEEDPLPGSKPTFVTSLKEKVLVEKAGDDLSEISMAVVNFALEGQFYTAANQRATESSDEEEDEEEDEEAPLPGSKPTFHTSLKERAVAEETDDASSEDIALAEFSYVQKEKNEIEARPAGRVEIVAQAPMKLELCRTLGHRVSVRRSALERRGLPRRGIPAWMTKRPQDDDKLPVNPVPGERAYTSAPEPKKLGFDDGSEQRIAETLILPSKSTFRKYLHHRFLIFRITDSVSVRRRLGEASRRKPGLAIATVLGVFVLLGLLTKLAVDFLDIGGSAAVASAASTDPALAAPSRLDLTKASLNPNTVVKKQSRQATTLQPVAVEAPSPTAEAAVVDAAPTVSVKAGSDPQKPSLPEKQPDSQPLPLAAAQEEIRPAAPASASGPMPDAPATNAPASGNMSLNLDERQKALEKALEEAILAMRSRSKPELYVRENEAKIIELQRNIQELIPVRSGHGFSGSAQSLALSRCLASVQLLGGRRQAARNVLLDLLDTITSTRSASDPEIRLTNHLLRLTEAKTEGSGLPLGAQLPLTPREMETMLVRFTADPQWEPSSGEVVAGGN